VIDTLLSSAEPSIRYRTLVHVLGHSTDTPSMRALAREIRDSRLARQLLSLRTDQGCSAVDPRRNRLHPYQKWQGPHFTLICLAEIGYPAGDRSLLPMRDRFYYYSAFLPHDMKRREGQDHHNFLMCF